MKVAVPFLLGLAAPALASLQVNISSRDSIVAAAKLKAADVMAYYHGDEPGHIPGVLPGPPPDGPYYWWNGGALMGAMIDYWHYTNDSTYNQIVKDALLFQSGPQRDFMEPNWTASLGNDDQAFWGMSALLAAEVNFPDPEPGQPSWLALAQGVFNTQAQRLDDTCGGGLRWQVFQFNTGFQYKNTIANGCFFNIGARLARYTHNQTYADHAILIWDWMERTGLIDKDYNVYDGIHAPECDAVNRAQYSYNAAVLLQGATFLYDFTNGSKVWRDRINKLLDQTIHVFFPNGTATEKYCEIDGETCTTDMLSFKGFLHRWLAVVAQVAPFTRRRITKVLKTSAAAAVRQCTAGDSGRECGFQWNGTFDGTTGLGQEMNVLGALVSVLVDHDDYDVVVKPPVTNTTGGTSVGDPGAGGTDGGRPQAATFAPITTWDTVGAGFAMTAVMSTFACACVWMSTDLLEGGRKRQQKGKGKARG
ncbi:hypothetical protein MAPG_10327 [Magnaporthiopsis poae ATCC 64411]|uniref:Mannan endo-1,6-alpha-mannosidase n=1 Tax=Magnaporthiopsis poae (strain ATCC 64411 / 73-15) TaxID=644358 RepID=A0A0C4ECB2_MAGP6|nr:hypothetical protein MAPG_10327 [Magnaporthiopsis poae ATCC 64411]